MSDDSTKEKLNIDSMDLNVRKDLFNKFVDAGGQVDAKKHTQKIVKAPPRKKAPVQEVKSNNTPAKKEQKEAPKQKPIAKPKKKNDSIFNAVELSAEDKAPIGTRFIFWLDAVKHSTINLVGNKISPSFYTFVTRTLINLLVENQSTLMSALYPHNVMTDGHKLTHEDIVKTFTDEEDLEILQRYTEIYKEETYREFVSKYKNVVANLTPADYIDVIIKMIKPIFITKNYSNRIKISAENVLIIYAKEEGMSKALLNKKLLLFKKSVDVIYGDYYNKLFSLLKFATKLNINELSVLLNLLNISEEDYVGYYTKKRKEENKKKEKEIEDSKKEIGKTEEEEKYDKLIETGLDLIDSIVDYEKLKTNLDYIDVNDKVYRAMTLCDYLDSEYSVIFSNKYVKYNIILDDHQKIDYATDFNHAIMDISELNSKLNEYYSIASSIVEINSDADVRVSNRSVLLKERTAQLSLISKNIRSQYANVISGLKKSIDRLMLNKEERNRIIGNPDEVLSLSASKDSGGKKRLSGSTVMTALTEAFYYITALNFLLTSGELSGNGMLVDQATAHKPKPDIRETEDTEHEHKDDKTEEAAPKSAYIEENETNDEGIIEIEGLKEGDDETLVVMNATDEENGEDSLIHTSKV